MELQRSNRISKPSFMSLSNLKAQQDIVYPQVIAGDIKIHYTGTSSKIAEQNFATDSLALDIFIERHEPIRNYLAGKKLRGSKLSKVELLVLDRLNDKLDELLVTEATTFQKESKDLIAEANRIISRAGLKIGKA